MEENKLQKIFDKAKYFDKGAPTSFDFHFYEVLDKKIYSELNYKKEDFNKIIDNFRSLFFRKEGYENAKSCIEYIRDSHFYIKGVNKTKYDNALKRSLKRKLEDKIKDFVIRDKILDNDERSIVEDHGKKYGFTQAEIDDIIKEQKTKFGFEFENKGTTKTEKAANTSKTTTSKTTTSGFPILEIDDYYSDYLTFENVELNETIEKIITIKNGGGGTLDAKIKFKEKWLNVTPLKIHQSNLPQAVTVKIDTAKDKSLKYGHIVEDLIHFTYLSGGQTIDKAIRVKLIIEGYDSLVNRLTKNSTILSGILSGLMGLYIFSKYSFSGWETFLLIIFGGILVGGFLWLFRSDDMEVGEIGCSLTLVIIGVLGLIVIYPILLLMASVFLTYLVSKNIFKKYTKKAYVVIIPVFFIMLFIAFYWGTGNNIKKTNNSDHHYSNTTFKNNATTNNVRQYKVGYIKAKNYVNVRTGPSTNYSVIGKKYRGETVNILELNNSGWCKILYNNRIGYVSNNLVSFNPVRPHQRKDNNSKNGNSKPKNNIQTICYTNGDKYIGKLRNNKKEGKGIYYFANGNKYVGMFKNDMKNGKGILFFTDSSKCEGYWKDDKREGKFIYYNTDGSSEKQKFSKGIRIR